MTAHFASRYVGPVIPETFAVDFARHIWTTFFETLITAYSSSARAKERQIYVLEQMVEGQEQLGEAGLRQRPRASQLEDALH